jgi:hypothetical protein
MVQIPAAQVGAADELPRVCARHGRAATQLKSLRFASRPRPWSYAFIPLGLLFFLIALVALREDVWAPRWPWCERCTVQRVVRLVAGIVVFVGAFGVLTVVADRRGTAATVLTLSLIVVLVLGIVLISRSYTSAIAGAYVVRGAQWVRIPRAHERFAEQVRVYLPAPAPAPAMPAPPVPMQPRPSAPDWMRPA